MSTIHGSDSHGGPPSRRRARRLLLLACLAGAAGAVPAFAATLSVTSSRLTSWNSATAVCVSPGTQTVTANADTFVVQDKSSQNFGTQQDLEVRADSSDKDERTLVRFTLPSVPAGCAVTSAKLRLNASRSDTGRTVGVFRAAAAWTETGATWNNQPGITGTAVTATSGTGWREWTVTAHVQAQYAGPNNGFSVRDSNEASGNQLQQVFNSREQGTNRPELVVTFG